MEMKDMKESKKEFWNNLFKLVATILQLLKSIIDWL